MAHFAKLDETSIVVEVVRVHNNELLVDGIESEDRGIEFLVDWSGGHTNWKQTSYEGAIRKNYAGKGYLYDPVRDAFIQPKSNCHPEQTLDEDTCRWVCSNPEHDLA